MFTRLFRKCLPSLDTSKEDMIVPTYQKSVLCKP